MKLLVTYSRTFSAGHQTLDGLCARGFHGHEWTLAVSARGSFLTNVIDAMVGEFEYRSFNDMAKLENPNPQNLAPYFAERLRMPLGPVLVAVTIGFPGLEARVEI